MEERKSPLYTMDKLVSHFSSREIPPERASTQRLPTITGGTFLWQGDDDDLGKRRRTIRDQIDYYAAADNVGPDLFP